ncbi:hypothetical protein HPK19_11870 [Arthrobacter citreus]|nr:hypothetical protein HPK19_11870 [Arthrobacter citreus]
MSKVMEVIKLYVSLSREEIENGKSVHMTIGDIELMEKLIEKVEANEPKLKETVEALTEIVNARQREIENLEERVRKLKWKLEMRSIK